jgi:hypothetical protein
MSTVHEDFARKTGHGGGSDRNFGLVFTGAFLSSGYGRCVMASPSAFGVWL